MPTEQEIEEAIRHACQAPYFNALYARIDNPQTLSGLPVTDPRRLAELSAKDAKYLKVSAEVASTALDTAAPNGVTFGTHYTPHELRIQVTSLAAGLQGAGVRARDRVALTSEVLNIFTPFPVVPLALDYLQTTVIPLTGTDPRSVCTALSLSGADVLLAPSSLLPHLFDHALQKQNESLDPLRCIICLGLPPPPSQRYPFPNSIIFPFPLGCPQTGFVAQPASANDHTVFRALQEVQIELLDSRGANAARGRIVVTNFARRLTPVIRFPLEIEAEWVSQEDNEFRLTKRAFNYPPPRDFEVDVEYERMQRVLARIVEPNELRGLQIELIRNDEGGTDVLLRIVADRTVAEAILAQKETIKRELNVGGGGVRVEQIEAKDLVVDVVTGEPVDVVDWRDDEGE